MVVSGLIIYYLYMKPEGFENPTTTIPSGCPTVTVPTIPLSCLSRYFGIGFNIYPANNTAQSQLPANVSSTNLFIIEHIPTVYNGTLGSMYAISADGQLTLKTRNDQDTTQWWVFTKKNDTTSDYYTISPFTLINADQKFALQYENGNLALRPYNDSNVFESQKWIFSTTKITRGIPVLNYSPASMFSPEFDPYSSSSSITTSTSQQNNQQVNEVLNAIKTNIQQYLAAIGASPNAVPRMSTSSLGNKNTPLNINLNLGSATGGTVGGNSVSSFANIDGTTSPNDVLSLLDRYEGGNSADNLVNSSDLMNAINASGGCPNINLADYTSNRVSSCNCKL